MRRALYVCAVALLALCAATCAAAALPQQSPHAATRASPLPPHHAASWERSLQAPWTDAQQSALRGANVFQSLTHGVHSGVVSLAARFNPTLRAAAAAASPSLSFPGRAFRPMSGGDPLATEFELPPEQVAAVRAAFETDPKALGMRNQSPRFGPKELEFNNDYVMGIAIAAGIGVGIGVLQLFFTGVYMFFRCCCWRWLLKKRSEHEDPTFKGYQTWWDKYWPVVFVVVFMLVASAFAVVGIVYNSEVSRSFSTTDARYGIGPLAVNVMEHMDGWVAGISRLVERLLVDPDEGVQQVYQKINAIMPPRMQDDALGLQTRSSQFAGDTQSHSVSANGTIWSCTLQCAALAAASSELSSQLGSQVLPVISSFQSAVDDVSIEFMNQADVIAGELDSANSQMSTAREDLIDAKTRKDVSDYAEDVEGYDVIRNAVFLAIFSLVFLVSVITLLGLAMRKGWPFKCTFAVGPFYLFLVWILFGIHWGLGLFIGDSCAYMDEKMLTLHTELDGHGNLASVANACLTNTSLLVALGLERHLNFSQVIQFPQPLSNAEVDDKFNLPALQELQSLEQGLNHASFGFDAAQHIDTYIFNMNQVPKDGGQPAGGHTRATVDNCHNTQSACYNNHYGANPSNLDYILDQHRRAFDGLQVHASIQTALVSLQSRSAALRADTAALKGQFVSFSDNVAQMESALDPIVGLVSDFRSQAYCYFLAEDFGGFKRTYCDQLGNSIQFMTLALFLIGLSCFPIVWCSRWSSYRVQFVARVVPHAFDENAWMQAHGHAAPVPQMGGFTSPDGFGEVQLAAPAEPSAEREEQEQESESEEEEESKQEEEEEEEEEQEEGQTQQEGAQQGQTNWQPNTAAHAISAPSYQEALAAQANNAGAQPQQQYPQQQQAQQGQTQGQAPPAQQQHPQFGGTYGAVVPQAERPMCDSCQTQPAVYRCAGCEECHCLTCDDALHTTFAQKKHERTQIV